MRLLRISAAIIAALTPASTLHAQNQQCAAALISNTSILQSDYASRLRVAEQITEENFDEQKRSGAIEFVVEGIPFEGDFESFKSARDILRRSFSNEQTQLLKQRSFQTELSAEGAAAFTDCMRNSTFSGTRMWVAAATPEAVTLVIRRIAPPGSDGNARVDLEVTGGTLRSTYNPELPGNWEQTVFVSRRGRRDLVATVNGGGSGDSIALPYLPRFQPIVETVLRKSDPVAAQGRGEGNNSSTVCTAVRPGYFIVPSRTALVTTTRYDNRMNGIAAGTRLSLATNRSDQVCVTAATECTAAGIACGVAGHALFYEQRIRHRRVG